MELVNDGSGVAFKGDSGAGIIMPSNGRIVGVFYGQANDQDVNRVAATMLDDGATTRWIADTSGIPIGG
jgi:hypothetical protein